MLQSRGGAGNGLGALMQAFENGGIGHLFQSWVGNGQNLPVSASQIQDVSAARGSWSRSRPAPVCSPRMWPSTCRPCCRRSSTI